MRITRSSRTSCFVVSLAIHSFIDNEPLRGTEALSQTDKMHTKKKNLSPLA